MTDKTPPEAVVGEPEADAAAQNNRRFKNIPLEEPIKRGDTSITSITLRKPQAGELRGLTLEHLLTTDVDTILKLVPRISDPILADHEVAAMDPADLTECGGAIRGFFMTKAQQETMDRMIAEQQSRS